MITTNYSRRISAQLHQPKQQNQQVNPPQDHSRQDRGPSQGSRVIADGISPGDGRSHVEHEAAGFIRPGVGLM
jgi:hypothetical protein